MKFGIGTDIILDLDRRSYITAVLWQLNVFELLVKLPIKFIKVAMVVQIFNRRSLL